MDVFAPHPAAAGAAEQPTDVGEYRLGRHLARRAAVDVYDATHTPTGGARRVYVLRAAAMQDNAFVHRVVCEADAAHWIRHPAAARLESHGDTPSKRLFLAVERPAGRPFGAVIAEARRLEPRRVVRLAGRVVEALAEAHALGLVHGRLTPDAIVVPDGLDASATNVGPGVSLTGLGTSAVHGRDPAGEGELPYMSPEQLAGSDPDARSDVYGLASVLHHALTGVAPEPAARLGSTSAVGAVLDAARHPDPARRPESIKAFWDDVLEALVADAMRATGAPAPAPGAADAPFDERAALAHLELADFTIPAASPRGLTPPIGVDALQPTAPAMGIEPGLMFGGAEFSSTLTPAAGVAAVPAAPATPAAPLAAHLPAPAAVPPAPAQSTTPESQPAELRATGARAAVSAPIAPTRRRSPAVYAMWAAVPVAVVALGWPLMRGSAHAADAAAPKAAAPAPAAPAAAVTTAPTAAPVPAPAAAAPTPAVATAPAPAPAAPAAQGSDRATARQANAAGTRRASDAGTTAAEAERRTADAVPVAPQVEMPSIYILNSTPAEAPARETRSLVKPEEFNKRIRVPAAGTANP